MKIEAVKSELKIILNERLEDCFDVLSTIIKKDIVAYNEFVQLRSNATRIGKQYYLTEIDYEQYNREMSKLTNGILGYIDNISISDIEMGSFDKDKLPPISKIKPNSVGLLLGDFDVELKKVIDLIDSAEIIRAIGFGRQYKIEGNTLPVVEKYYNAIEDRLSRKANGKAFHYRRITVQKLEERFREHIKKCFRNVRGSSNECGMVFRENLYLSLRYLVIDDKKMILNLYTRDNVGIQDNRMLFHTEDKSIIEYFITHFDDAWDNERYKGNVINTEEDFERFIPVNEKLYENLDKIKRHIREIYNNSITSIHANSYLTDTVSQTEHLRFNYLVVKHKKKNSELENIFRWYMENLNEDCSYKTLSF
ncbi:MAG: hypothetical protein AB8G15_05135, partial [Saprospiraceae bacterium]